MDKKIIRVETRHGRVHWPGVTRLAIGYSF